MSISTPRRKERLKIADLYLTVVKRLFRNEVRNWRSTARQLLKVGRDGKA